MSTFTVIFVVGLLTTSILRGKTIDLVEIEIELFNVNCYIFYLYYIILTNADRMSKF